MSKLYNTMNPPFANDHYYHIYNRGILKLPIFFDKSDYLRFVYSLDQFNDIKSVPQFGHPMSKPRKPLISIIAWCLMPNHFHIFIRQETDCGISRFMQKLSIGYTKYINTKYDRSGHLFQGKFKARLVDNDAYFLHISRYIHLNPIKQTTKINPKELLHQYEWSSYLDWVGINKFPSLLNHELVKEIRQMNKAEYTTFVLGWIHAEQFGHRMSKWIKN